MATTKEKMIEAQQLIKARQYDDARRILVKIDHPKATEWLAKIDKVAPVKKTGFKMTPVIAGGAAVAVIGVILLMVFLTRPAGPLAVSPAPAPRPERVAFTQEQIESMQAALTEEQKELAEDMERYCSLTLSQYWCAGWSAAVVMAYTPELIQCRDEVTNILITIETPSMGLCMFSKGIDALAYTVSRDPIEMDWTELDTTTLDAIREYCQTRVTNNSLCTVWSFATYADHLDIVQDCSARFPIIAKTPEFHQCLFDQGLDPRL